MLPTESQPGQGLPELRPATATDVRDRPAGGTRDLPAVIGAAHRAVLNELAGTTAESGYLAIARLSGHLAAVRRAVCTPLRKRPGSPLALISDLCAQGRAAEWSLWLLQGRIAGDMLASSVNLDSVYTRLGQQLTDYMAGERALLAWIEVELPAADRRRLSSLSRARPDPPASAGPAYRLRLPHGVRFLQLLGPGDGRGRRPPPESLAQRGLGLTSTMLEVLRSPE